MPGNSDTRTLPLDTPVFQRAAIMERESLHPRTRYLIWYSEFGEIVLDVIGRRRQRIRLIASAERAGLMRSTHFSTFRS
jgi:hypothetical protein